MPGAAYDAGKQILIQIVSQSPHTFAYKLWFGRPTDSDWQELEQGDINSVPRPHGPFPAGTKVDYDIVMGGNPRTDWRTEVRVTQAGQILACSPGPDSGTTNDSGVDEHEAVIVLQ